MFNARCHRSEWVEDKKTGRAADNHIRAQSFHKSWLYLVTTLLSLLSNRHLFPFNTISSSLLVNVYQYQHHKASIHLHIIAISNLGFCSIIQTTINIHFPTEQADLSSIHPRACLNLLHSLSYHRRRTNNNNKVQGKHSLLNRLQFLF